ncbi:hypothetical protein D3C85_1528930 [compost metagenome]
MVVSQKLLFHLHREPLDGFAGLPETVVDVPDDVFQAQLHESVKLFAFFARQVIDICQGEI